MDLGSFGLNVFLVQLCFGAVDLGAKAACALALSRCGRRPVQALSLSVAGACLLASTPLPAGEPGMPGFPAALGGVGGLQWGPTARMPGFLGTCEGSGARGLEKRGLHVRTPGFPAALGREWGTGRLEQAVSWEPRHLGPLPPADRYELLPMPQFPLCSTAFPLLLTVSFCLLPPLQRC